MRKFVAKSVGLVYLMLLVHCAYGQQANVFRIGVLFPGGPLSGTIDGLKDGLKELGLHEGSQFTLAVRDTKGDPKAAVEAARNFEREKANFVYAITSSVIMAAKEATQSIPIVFAIGSDPVALKLVADFAKPGGRLTGVHYLVRDLTGKRLEVLKEIVPKLVRVITFYDPGRRIAADAAGLARDDAKRLGFKVVERHVASVEELRKRLHALKTGDVDTFFYIPDPMIVGQIQLIIDTTKAKKLPSMFQSRLWSPKEDLPATGKTTIRSAAFRPSTFSKF